METKLAPSSGVLVCILLTWGCMYGAESASQPTRLLVDTDVDSDDVFGILYLLKQDSSRFSLQGITISANAWSDAGHAVNLIYDMLHMMGRDDVQVGVGGEGGITYEGNFSSNVGGFLPLIDQGSATWGGCRYRQAIPPGSGGLLDIDTMLGVRKQFLPRGKRHYEPLKQPTSQTVMLEVISNGPTVVILLGAHTNFATLLMTHPEVKKNVERIYVMGGGVRSRNPTGCCPKGSPATCVPTQCGNRGNLFDADNTNPWAEFNMFMDPFAAYQVFHAGIPITLVPLDATNTIPISTSFYKALEQNQHTYEAQYVYQVLQITKDTWFNDNFNKEYFLWDSFTSGVAISGILTNHSIKRNKYCALQNMNVTVVTSNKPYGAQDGSNPNFYDRTVPRFNLRNDSVHSGHVQTGLQDSFCLLSGKKGKCQDGYTMESYAEGAWMQVGTHAKLPKSDSEHPVLFSFQTSFIESLNNPKRTGLTNFEAQFPCYKGVLYKAQGPQSKLGKSVIFDMDISPGDIITLLYLLKLPRQTLDLKAITISATGWANAATIDVIYDILHMMGRDDIPVGLGEFFALGQAYPPLNTTGNCKYRQWIPNGAGGFIDSDTVFGLARDLPHSPRRYTAENSVLFGAPRDTKHPELRQPKAQEVIRDVLKQHSKKKKVTFLTGGPLTNIATFLDSNSSQKALVEEFYIAGGSIGHPRNSVGIGNIYTLPQNKRSEFNFFLDPQAAHRTLNSDLKIFLVPLDALHGSSLARTMLDLLDIKKETPEAKFVHKLLLTIHQLELQSGKYSHTAKLLEEVMAAVALAEESKFRGHLKQAHVVVECGGDVSTDGWTRLVDSATGEGKEVQYLGRVSFHQVARTIVHAFNTPARSAVLASFAEQARSWSSSPCSN